MSATIICKNCDHHFKGNFCPHCGQSAKVEHIGIHYFLHDIPHSILHIDKGFFYTLGKLFTSPGKTLKEYLEGKRVKHFRPFAFVLLMSTIATLLIKGCDHLINLKFEKEHPGEMIDSTHTFFGHYPSVLIFILIPLLSLITWLCFYKRKYNYWEHFLINTYVAAFLNLFLLIINAARVINYYTTGSTSVSFTIFMFFFMTYYGYTFGVLMRDGNNTRKNILILCLMNFLLAGLYMTAFSVTGITAPLWGK